MKKVARAGLVCGLLALAPTWVGAQTDLSAQQAEAQKQRAELQQRIKQLQKHIETTQSDQKDAAQALRDVETRISTTDRELETLLQRHKQVQSHLADLQRQIEEQQQQQDVGRQQLAEQLRAQYASGLSPWSALLSGQDPQEIQRELGYLGYINQAQAQQVRQLQQGLERLQQLKAAVLKNQTELTQLAQKTEAQKQQLQEQQTERGQVLKKIETELSSQQQQAQRLSKNDERLGQLITGLEQEIARQAELRRQAEERRRAEEARRKAEEARRLAEQKRLEEERRQQAFVAEQQRLAAAAAAEAQLQQRQAQAQQSQDEAELVALRQVQLERDRQLAAEREAARKEQERWHALAHTPAQPALVEAPPVQTAPKPEVRAEPTGGFNGLKKGLPPPVRGEQLGMFGVQRPDGGTWRGVVLRAPAGTPVKAIAAGRVVFANWMSGFGNLLIVDHGEGFLSVYGNNQSVLKQVGDVVASGDAIARVGATGGQVEPGVYIEIRHHGQPVNPQLWLSN